MHRFGFAREALERSRSLSATHCGVVVRLVFRHVNFRRCGFRCFKISGLLDVLCLFPLVSVMGKKFNSKAQPLRPFDFICANAAE